MKKYTIVYSESFNVGSHTNSITHFKHIECLPEELYEVIKTTIGLGNVWFVFDGHCETINI